jgi:hypothetical protein
MEEELSIEDVEALLKKAEKMEQECQDLIDEQNKILLVGEDKIEIKSWLQIRNEYKSKEII